MAAANPVQGAIEITLAGKPVTFRIGFNEVCALEERLGKPMNEVFNTARMGFALIREVIYVGCRDAGMTREEVGEALGQHPNFAELGDALRRSMELSMPHLFRAGAAGAQQQEEEGTTGPLPTAQAQSQAST